MTTAAKPEPADEPGEIEERADQSAADAATSSAPGGAMFQFSLRRLFVSVSCLAIGQRLLRAMARDPANAEFQATLAQVELQLQAQEPLRRLRRRVS